MDTYEKAYKAVLQTAKQWIKDGCTDKEKICLECVFPELRESDDEMIRNWLLVQLETNYKGNYWAEKAVAYLEKQEQNIVVYDGDNYESAKEKAWNNFSGKASLIPGAKSIHDNGFRGGYQFGIHEEKPLKWTVHDEAVRKEAIACLEEWKHLIPCSSIEDYNNILNWLKEELSIHTEKQQGQKPNIELIQRSWYMEGYHDREFGKEPMWLITACDGGPIYELNPKYGKKLVDEKKPAWSEEDERIRKLLIWQVHRNIEDETNDLAQSVYDSIKGHDPDLEESIEDWKKCLAWLKSLRPCRPSWKPSEEQLNALNFAITYFMHETNYKNPTELRELYDDLLELK